MELIHHGRQKTSKFAPEDFISKMPDNVVTSILDRLPLQDAVRMGILSSNWRFKWTMLSQLVFDENFFKYLSKTKAKNNYVGIISRILLHVRGVIAKFVLFVDKHGYPVLDDEDVNNWVLFLSRKGIKDLTLANMGGRRLALSTHLFSCLELTHLKLHDCYFHPPPTFHGFSNLLSLELCHLCVEFEEDTEFGKFFTRCPILEILTLDDIFFIGKVKVVKIAKIENLKRFSLQLCVLNSMEITNSSTIFEFLCCLPKLQELELDFEYCTLISGTEKRIPTAFPCLKALRLSRICLDDGMKLSCAFDLIWSFPNMQTLEITTSKWHADQPPVIVIDDNPRGQLQLRSVMFEHWKGSEYEFCLLKFLLVCSPFLKRIAIRPHRLSAITLEEKLKFASKLLKVHRASPIVDIDLS